MKIEILHVANCPNHAVAIGRLREVLSAEMFEAQVSEILVDDAALARSLRFPGSPTIRVNGRDVEPQTNTLPRLQSRAACTRTVRVHRPNKPCRRQSKKPAARGNNG